MSENGFEKVSKVSNFKDKISAFWNDITQGEKTYNKISNRFINGIKVIIASSKKFMLDDCLTKASSIAYTTVISLIPTLTVALTFYSIFSGVGDKKDELFRKIALFMAEHNIKLNIDPIIEALLSLIENAGKIGGVGAIVLIFSATAVLRTLEKSLNDIWVVKKSRSFLLKIIYYWAALTLGPIIMISGTTVATQVSSAFSSPNFKSAYFSSDNKLWIVGSKSSILNSENPNRISKISDLLPFSVEKIDFDNQKNYLYDFSKNVFKKQETGISETEFNQYDFRDIQFIGNSGWIVGDSGIIIRTMNNGESWHLDKFHSFGFNDIYMVNRKLGFIAADNGYLLSTKDSGKSWEVLEWKNFSSNLNSISFYEDRGIITGDRGIIITTNNAGKTWTLKRLNHARRKKRFINLNNSFQVNDKKIILVGDEGTILFSNDSGNTWKNRRFLNKNYSCAFFVNSLKGYVAGEKGIIVATEDGGEKWQRRKMPRFNVNKLLYDNGSIWAVGDTGLIVKSDDDGKSWQGVKGMSLVALLLNFFAPFIFIWVLFLLMYIVLPNTKVPFKPAAIGAAFTSAVWVVFILIFTVYTKSFAKGTVAIYGALAAIPLFLLMVYASSVIILYGAQVSYILMYPHLYLNIRKIGRDSKETHIFYGLSILYQVYKKFEDGKGATSKKDLLKITSHQQDELDDYLELFIGNNIILETEEECYIPANSSKNILLSDTVDLIHDVSLRISEISSASGPLKDYLEGLFSNLKSSRKNIIGNSSLSDLIKEVD